MQFLQTKLFRAVVLCAFVFSSGLYALNLPTIGADLGFKSKYVWRGLCFNEDKVFWPDVWISWYGLTVTGFLSIDMTDYNAQYYLYNYQSEVTDIDILVDYSKSFGKFNASVGFNHYMFPGYGEGFAPLEEIYLKCSGSFFIQPSIIANIDITKDKSDDDKTVTGAYISPKISRTFTVGCATSTIGVSAGFGTKKFNKLYALYEKNTLTDVTISLSTILTPPEPLSSHATMTLDVNYAMTPYEKIREALGSDAHFWAGITVNMFHTFTQKGGE